MADVTQILSQIESGDPSATEQLLPLVYDELRKLAAAKLVHEKPGQTLQATALVHEERQRWGHPSTRPSARTSQPSTEKPVTSRQGLKDWVGVPLGKKRGRPRSRKALLNPVRAVDRNGHAAA